MRYGLASRTMRVDTMLRFAISFVILSLIGGQAHARGGSEPCSRGKGGISHCENGKFICKDGSVSGSTRTCSDFPKPVQQPKHKMNLKPRVGSDGSVRYGMPTPQESP